MIGVALVAFVGDFASSIRSLGRRRDRRHVRRRPDDRQHRRLLADPGRVATEVAKVEGSDRLAGADAPGGSRAAARSRRLRHRPEDDRRGRQARLGRGLGRDAERARPTTGRSSIEDWADDKGIDVGDPLDGHRPERRRGQGDGAGHHPRRACSSSRTSRCPLETLRERLRGPDDSTVFVAFAPGADPGDARGGDRQGARRPVPERRVALAGAAQGGPARADQPARRADLRAARPLGHHLPVRGRQHALLTIHERTREIGMLRAIGTSGARCGR